LKSILALLSLSVAAQAWQPAADSMLTEWGAQVTPENAWREYPRPLMQRKQWTNLNGLWDYAVMPGIRSGAPDRWDGKILVPFAIESALSGVKKPFTPDDALWYRRPLEITPKPGKRYLLNFEAVDYQATCWINGKEVGKHSGGNLPFSFDITGALQAGSNTLWVRVTDATGTAWQLHGKQTLKPHGIFYTAVSGIWQTVWLEEVPELHIRKLRITPKIDGTVAIVIDIEGPTNKPASAKATASLDGRTVAETLGPPDRLTLKITDPKLWSPGSPTLYDLSITLGEDTVTSFIGLRETTLGKDAAGNLRFQLNGREIFHFGPLDQGWWPDGLLTPPSDAAMCSDLDFLKAAGFNLLRKHVKVEPRRYYHHCDKIGLLVWQDQVSSFVLDPEKRKPIPPWSRLKPAPVDGEWPDDAHRQFMAELKSMIDTLHDHPSIVQWVPFNEAWGQHRTMEVGRWLLAYDPGRQINIASGGNFWPVGHVVDAHDYPHPGFPFDSGKDGRFEAYVKVVGEFGGHGFPVEGHLWNSKAGNWGYGGLPKDKEEWLERYKTSIHKLADLRKNGIAAGIYTQTTDVEGEINGLITYDRRVRKVSAETLAAIHRAAGLLE
jgi:beta-galactosidase